MNQKVLSLGAVWLDCLCIVCVFSMGLGNVLSQASKQPHAQAVICRTLYLSILKFIVEKRRTLNVSCNLLKMVQKKIVQLTPDEKKQQQQLWHHVPQQVLHFCRPLINNHLSNPQCCFPRLPGLVAAGITVCGLDSCFSQSCYYLCLPHAQLSSTTDWQCTHFI